MAETIDPDTSPNIKIATYNIFSGRQGRLEMALRELDRLNVDVAFLTEAKLTGIYTQHCLGYNVLATDAVSPHKGGVALAWRAQSPNWTLESQRKHGPNVISCELKTGHRRFLLVGAYVSPSESDGSTMAFVELACARRTGLRTVIMGDFNVDFNEPGATGRDTDIMASLASLGVNSTGDCFRLSRRHREGFTWKQVRNGELMTSRCDSILSNCPRDFSNLQIRSPRGQLSDHDAVCAWIIAGSIKRHRGYLCARKSIPWKLPNALSDVDVLMENLRSH